MINVSDIQFDDQYWRDSVYDGIFLKKEYEHKDIAVEKGDIVVDLGANIGIFSLYAEDHGAEFIYAFEPIPHYLGFFKTNLQKYSNIELSEAGIGQKTEKDYIVYDEDGNTILAEVYNDFKWKSEERKSLSINIISINDFMDNMDNVDFLKVDIEGSEYKIFEIITNENLKKIKKIACEFHWNYNDKLSKIIDKLKENNFDVYHFYTDELFKIGKLFAKKN